MVSRRIRLELAWTRWNQTTSRIEEQLVDLGREPDSQGYTTAPPFVVAHARARAIPLGVREANETHSPTHCCGGLCRRLWIEAKDLRRSMSRVGGLLAKYRVS